MAIRWPLQFGSPMFEISCVLVANTVSGTTVEFVGNEITISLWFAIQLFCAHIGWLQLFACGLSVFLKSSYVRKTILSVVILGPLHQWMMQNL